MKFVTTLAALFSFILFVWSLNYAGEIKNEYLRVRTDPLNARFVLYTTGGDPKIQTDNEKNLLFERFGEITSFTTVRIDGKDEIFGSEKGKLTKSSTGEDNNLVSEWEIDKIFIRQTLSFVKGKTTGNMDTLKIEYLISNTDVNDHQVGLRVLKDTLLGSKDGAPFSVPGTGEVVTDTSYEKDKIPDYWYAYDNMRSPTVRAQGSIRLPGYPIPDRLVFSNWSRMHNSLWDIPLEKGRKFKESILTPQDSAVSVFWEPRWIKTNSAQTFSIMYGIYGAVVETSDIYNLALSCPVKVKYGQPFLVTCDVENKLDKNPVEKVTVNLELPENVLTLTSGNGIVTNYEKLTPQQIVKMSWKLVPSASFVGVTTMTVTVKGEVYVPPKMEQKSLTVSRQVTIYSPLISGEYRIDEANKRIKTANTELKKIKSQLAKLLVRKR